MPTPEPLLTVKEAAVYLGCSRNTLYQYVRRGIIPSVRVGCKFIRFDRNVLADWLRQTAEPLSYNGAAHD